ncbi:MAG: epoxyqueuosine reductase [Clostridiales bacterium]|nr:epoxyqueuosine reductase [Clostridiales bacterium]
MKEAIRKIVLSLGADVCGFASTDRFQDAPAGFAPTDVWSACKTVIAFGIALPKGLLEVPGNLIYGYFNNQTAGQTDRIALEAARKIERDCQAKAVPVPCDAPYDAWDEETMTGTGILSMRHAAAACGLGQPGKSGLLLNPTYGNRLTIGVILTDLSLPSDDPCESICLPDCTRCIDACPANAIQTEGTVRQSACRPNTFGQNARGFATVNCNRCRTVCPMRFGKGTNE